MSDALAAAGVATQEPSEGQESPETDLSGDKSSNSAPVDRERAKLKAALYRGLGGAVAAGIQPHIMERAVDEIAALAVSPAPLVLDEAKPRRRLRACVEAWPDCESGDYNPSCCRFPKSCSAGVYDLDRIQDEGLEPVDEDERGGGR